MFIAEAGKVGQCPLTIEYCKHYEDAVDCLAMIHALTEDLKRQLRETGYIELNWYSEYSPGYCLIRKADE